MTSKMNWTMDGALAEGSASPKVLEWRVKKAKLALAVAVIKSRPPGKSGRLHAEDLAIKLRSQDEAWRSKAQGLQEEVLRLRQELLLTKLHSEPREQKESEAGNGPMDVSSQELMVSVKDQLNSDIDSGCGTENNTETQPTETQLPTQSCTDTSEQPFLPPLVSGPQLPFSTSSQGGPQGKSMLLHMQFLQSLCGLQRMERKGGPKAAELSSRDRSLVADSVCQLLTCMVAASRDSQTLPPPPMLLQAARVAAQGVDYWSSHRDPSVQFVTHVEDALKELTGVLLRNDQLNRSQVQEKLTECLIHLGESSLLKSLLIRHVLSEIDRLADHLWLTCQEEREGPKLFDVTLYENSFYLFWILEQLLQGEQGPGEAGGTSLHWTPEQKALLGHLESRVLLLSEEFPLFALYLWRIGALFTPSDTTRA